MPVNTRLLRLAIAKQAEPVLRKQVRGLMALDFETKKEQFLESFDEHPVTRELEGGPTAFSSIPELAGAGGNLFSFLGILKGKDPVGALRSYLDKKITLSKPDKGVIKGSKIVYTAKVSFPTVEDVNQAMQQKIPLPWTERSFTQLISRGIPGLPSYLFRESPPFSSPKPSQSGTAVQAKDRSGKLETIRSGSFEGVPYVGELLAGLKRLFGSARAKS